MRRLLLAALLLGLAAPSVRAQADSIPLSALRTPTSPAFSILGITPASIERPGTPRAFAISLLEAGAGAGALPENYAAEFAPYWWGPRRNLTFDRYYRPDVLQALLQTFTVSVAVTTQTVGTDTTTRVGVGFVASPLPGRATAAMDSTVRALRGLQQQAVALRFRQIDAQRAGDSILARARGDSIAAVALQSQTVAQAVQTGDTERVGLVLQVAGALAGAYPGNDFGAGRVQRTGAWASVTYRNDQPRLDFIGLARYQRDGVDEAQDLWDVGGRAAIGLDRVSAGAEFLVRTAAADSADAGTFDDGTRFVGILEFRATNDLFLTFSFGQDFKVRAEGESPLVAILSGSLHFGDVPQVVGLGR